MKQITLDYCSFEIAKLLKEKGFDGDCDYWYGEYGEICCSPSVISVECWCPSQSLALKWLREVHDLAISIEFQVDCPTWKWRIYHIYSSEDKHTNFKHYSTYEEAVETALFYVLKNLI